MPSDKNQHDEKPNHMGDRHMTTVAKPETVLRAMVSLAAPSPENQVVNGDNGKTRNSDGQGMAMKQRNAEQISPNKTKSIGIPKSKIGSVNAASKMLPEGPQLSTATDTTNQPWGWRRIAALF